MQSNETIDVKSYGRRLGLARLRLLDKHGFYGLMLMHMSFKLDLNCPTAYTDGSVIAFSPKFMDELNDSEIEFVLMHEVMHVALKHCFRGLAYDPYIFNIACDIVVNSNILKSNNMDLKTITLGPYGEAMHLTPTKEEGYEYTAEDVYEMLLQDPKVKLYFKNLKKAQEALKKSGGDLISSNPGTGKGKSQNQKTGDKSKGSKNGESEGDFPDLNDYYGSFDDHTKWKNEDEVSAEEKDELNRIISSVAASSNSRVAGSVPVGAERIVNEINNPELDWRLVLNDFIQEEITDYSFFPPDKRYDDSGFFLPDFNETTEKIDKVFFMVDTSGSITTQELSKAYDEIKGCIEQFDHLEGYLGFFDSYVYKPEPFSSVEDLEKIKPRGGGGTSFHAIFNYIKHHYEGDYPKSVVIFTDGYAPFPSEKEALGIPILWLINNKVMTPTYGKVVRFNLKEKK